MEMRRMTQRKDKAGRALKIFWNSAEGSGRVVDIIMSPARGDLSSGSGASSICPTLGAFFFAFCFCGLFYFHF